MMITTDLKVIDVTVDKQHIAEMPKVVFPGRIEVVQSEREMLKAIEYLREARARLSSTAANYTAILERLNAEIKRLDAANKEAEEATCSRIGYRDSALLFQRPFS